tara:strand:- start:221 stop:3100 length:2880 start_codon:yes stop_codon:yes gene_type:complete
MTIIYNPDSVDLYDYQEEKTDYDVELPIDLDTNPQEAYQSWERVGCNFGAFGTCYWYRYGYVTRYRTDQVQKAKNEETNRRNDETNKENKKLNLANEAKNIAYQSLINTSKVSNRGEYASRRDNIKTETRNAIQEKAAIWNESTFNNGTELLTNDEINDFLNDLEGQYKGFYRDQLLYTWDPALGSQPEYGDFDPEYYGNRNSDVADKYREYEKNDDIDVTEGYGKANYYLWHYTQQGKAEKRRGNEVELPIAVLDYLEEAPDVIVDEEGEANWADQTDADLAFIRDMQLGIGDDQYTRLVSIPEIAELWETAKQAKLDNEENYFINLGKKYYLDVDNEQEFSVLFRLSDREEDKQIKFVNNIESGVSGGITELEDLITETIGVQGLTDTQKFAALNQNVLKDTIEELKKAKAKEQELELFQNFGTFGEIFDINKTLTDSLLNDTGIGGYLPFMGGKSGLTEETLQEQFKGVTGVSNEVVYNWQNWFDTAIKEKYQQDIELGYTLDEVEKNISIQKEFADSYITDYLKPRFDESRSMNEFVEYLDVRQEEQNPFQTQSLLNALNEIGNRQAKVFLDQIKDTAVDKKFDYNFYFDPTVSEGSEDNPKYINQRDTIAADWEQAKNNPDDIIEGVSGNTTWKAQAYRYGLDIESKNQFARLHYQVKGQHIKDDKGDPAPFDPAEDVVNYDKVKTLLYDKILPALEREGENTKTIFGNFIKPEEFADDMLEGLDPNLPETWEEVLKDEDGKSLIEGFTGDFEELKEYISDVFRTGSAQEIRQQIKFLNEKRKKPSQYLLGVEYIKRDEDYKPEQKLKGDTQLYKIFQDAGYGGTEDDFYENVFPDLDPTSQTILSQYASSQDGKFNLDVFGEDFRTDPYSAISSIGSLVGGDSPVDEAFRDDDDADDKVEEVGSFRFFTGDDDDDDDDDSFFYKKTKSGEEILSEYVNQFQNKNLSKSFSSFL